MLHNVFKGPAPLLVAFALGVAATSAAQPSPQPSLAPFVVPTFLTPTANPNSFDDPGMHFQPPDDWKRIAINPDAGGQGNSSQPPAVGYVRNQGRADSALITVTIASYEGTLEAFDVTNEQQMRDSLDSVYFAKRKKTTLANGMPAYWLIINSGNEAGKYVRRYEWEVVDTERSILVTLICKQGDIEEAEASKIMSSLYVVVYPTRHQQ